MENTNDPDVIALDIEYRNNISRRLYYPAFEHYIGSYKTAKSRTYYNADEFESLKKRNLITSTKSRIELVPIPTMSNLVPRLERKIFLDKRTGDHANFMTHTKYWTRNYFVEDIVHAHSVCNINTQRYGAGHVRYRVSSPLTRRQIVVKDYSHSITIRSAVEATRRMNFNESSKITNTIWNFYKEENYPVNDRDFQNFCLEYKFDIKDIFASGIKIYTRTPEDSLHLSFMLVSNFADKLAIIEN